MRAVAVTPGTKKSARLVDLPGPRRQSAECLIRVLEVGVDGTDREIDSGLYGAAPAGDDVLIIGHESLGEVVAASGVPAGPAAGELVVATVRRPDPQCCASCRSGEFDFCLTEDYQERGIREQHGYMAEFYAERADFLVRIPRALRGVAVLLEPLSVVEKAWRQVQYFRQRTAHSGIERVLITGAGAIGMFAALLARLHDVETLVYSRGEKKGVRGAMLDDMGAGYANATTHTLQDVAREFGEPDLIIEATGFSPFAWQSITALRVNGIACMLSVTAGQKKFEIESDRINQALVLGNRVVFGSVSSHRCDFEQGVRDMMAVRSKWPGLLERFITRRLPLESFREALDSKEPGGLKTVLDVAD
ncbi:MAG: glucose 1-dehydrogenase [Longimicrobiales bacterium]